MNNKMGILDIEIAVANLFGIRKNLIVPNVSWGLNIHECDLLVVSKAGYATEIEIKTSKYDLINDKKKWHQHKNKKIKRLFFAMPSDLLIYDNFIPDHAGIISVNERQQQFYALILRKPQINDCRKLTVDELIHLGKLASMRIWSLKNTVRSQRKA